MSDENFTNVLLVRHGHTPTTGKILPGRAPGLSLSKKGKEQAKQTAKRISHFTQKVSAIYASPMERTIETAEALQTQLGSAITEEPGLLETDYGSWTGAELAELYKHRTWPQLQNYPSSFMFPDGESIQQMQTRFVQTIHRLVRQNQGETIVLVAHADPIKAAVADALGTHLDLFQRIRIDPCSISAISYTQMKPTVCFVNSSANESAMF